jgi:kynureninase
VDLTTVRAKSLSLTDLFMDGVDTDLAGLGFTVVTPREHRRRGSQVSLRHPDAFPIMAALIDRGVIGDVRQPDLLRFGFNALYLSHGDVADAIVALGDVVRGGAYREPRFQERRTVS